MNESIGYGKKLTYGGVTVGKFKSVSITPPEIKQVDKTHFNSPNRTEEFQPGMKSPGEMKIGANWVPDDPGQSAIVADFASDNPPTKQCILSYENGASYQFDAYVKSCSPPGAGANETETLEATFTITGPVVPLLGSSAGLTALTLSGGGTLISAFTNGTYEYVYNVANATASITVTPTAAGTITVNGVAVNSGSASGSISLAAGAITTIKIVVQETGKAAVTYTIKATRAAA